MGAAALEEAAGRLETGAAALLPAPESDVLAWVAHVLGRGLGMGAGRYGRAVVGRGEGRGAALVHCVDRRWLDGLGRLTRVRRALPPAPTLHEGSDSALSLALVPVQGRGTALRKTHNAAAARATVQVSYATRVIGVDEYDAAVMREPDSCPLLAAGDLRSGRQARSPHLYMRG